MTINLECMDLIKLNNYELLKSKIFNLNLSEVAIDVNSLLLYSLENKVSVKIIEYLADLSDDLNFETPNGKIPLFIAIENKQFASANILIAKNADINYTNRFFHNVIMYMFKNQTINGDSLNYALNHGVDIYDNDKSKSIRNILDYAIPNKDTEILEIILNHVIFNNSFIINQIILSKNRTKIGKIEYEKMIDDEYKKMSINKNDNYFFNEACFHGHERIVKYLVEQGVNVNNNSYGFNLTGIILASLNGHESIVKYLIEHGADVNEYADDGNTALVRACMIEHEGIIKLLVENGANVNFNEGLDYRTAIYWMVQKGNYGMVKYLIDHGADVNVSDENQKSPIMLSAKYGHYDILKLLLTKNKENINLRNTKNNKTALDYAKEKGYDNIVKLLIDNGAIDE